MDGTVVCSGVAFTVSGTYSATKTSDATFPVVRGSEYRNPKRTLKHWYLEGLDRIDEASHVRNTHPAQYHFSLEETSACHIAVIPPILSKYGVFNTSSSPTMSKVTATGSGGTHSYGVFL